MRIQITIGDFSTDGHEKREKIHFEVNKTRRELRDGYFLSKNKFPEEIWPENVCYSDGTVSSDLWRKLKENLPGIEDCFYVDDFYDEGTTAYTTSEGFAEYVMLFISKSIPDLLYQQVEDDEFLWAVDDKREIGNLGYGLFCYS